MRLQQQIQYLQTHLLYHYSALLEELLYNNYNIDTKFLYILIDQQQVITPTIYILSINKCSLFEP